MVTYLLAGKQFSFPFGLLVLAGWLSYDAFRIPFCQQLSSKNSSLLPTWFLHGEVVCVATRDGSFTGERWDTLKGMVEYLELYF